MTRLLGHKAENDMVCFMCTALVAKTLIKKTNLFFCYLPAKHHAHNTLDAASPAPEITNADVSRF